MAAAFIAISRAAGVLHTIMPPLRRAAPSSFSPWRRPSLPPQDARAFPYRAPSPSVGKRVLHKRRLLAVQDKVYEGSLGSRHGYAFDEGHVVTGYAAYAEPCLGVAGVDAPRGEDTVGGEVEVPDAENRCGRASRNGDAVPFASLHPLVRHLRGIGELPEGRQVVELRCRHPGHPIRPMGDAHEPPRLACFGDRIAGDAKTLGLRCGENAFRSRELFYRRGVAVLFHVSIVSKYDTFATSLNVAWCCSGVFAFDRFVSSDDARKRSERDSGGSLDKARAVKVASARNTKPVSSYRFSENSWHRRNGPQDAWRR